jgi:phospholipase C
VYSIYRPQGDILLKEKSPLLLSAKSNDEVALSTKRKPQQMRASCAVVMTCLLCCALAAAEQQRQLMRKKSFWAFYPLQRCSDSLRLGGELARECRATKSPEACRAACLSSDACGGFDTAGKLYTDSCAGGRAGGQADLFVRQESPQQQPVAPPQSKIEHFVVLYMENRPFDHILGCMVGEGELVSATSPGIYHAPPANLTLRGKCCSREPTASTGR